MLPDSYRARYGRTCARRLLLHRLVLTVLAAAMTTVCASSASTVCASRLVLPHAHLLLMCLNRDITKLLGSMVSEDLMHWTETFNLLRGAP